VKVGVEVVGERKRLRKVFLMRRLNAAILAIDARETAANDVSRAARRTRPPAIVSLTQGQYLQSLARVGSTMRR
jgi:hypothetical protein